jgi:rSAM/selenodomain-associated transferase 1
VSATVIVLAKAPLPGRVKTRLTPPLNPGEAAALACAALEDTLEAAAESRAERLVLALDGEPGEWLPPEFDVIAQRGDGQAERLAAAFDDVGGPALLIAMDTPQVTPELLDEGLARLSEGAVIGPATDGGYWTIGLARPDARVFAGVPMSTRHTGAAQLARLTSLGLPTHHLPPLRDVDTFEDARSVAALAPDGRFATALRRYSAADPVNRTPVISSQRAR